ncbi:MAG: hypothetical protein R3B48_17165 [Kofleriaceae bacterium]
MAASTAITLAAPAAISLAASTAIGSPPRCAFSCAPQDRSQPVIGCGRMGSMARQRTGRGREVHDVKGDQPLAVAPGKRTRTEDSAPLAAEAGAASAGSSAATSAPFPQRPGDWVMDEGSLAAMGLAPECDGNEEPTSSSCQADVAGGAGDIQVRSGAARRVSTGNEGSLLMGTLADLAPPKPGINRTGFLDHSDGSFVRAGPAEAGAPLLHPQPLPPATRLFVSGVHPDTSQWWYVTAFLPDEIVRGYVQNLRVTTDLPEPTAKLHQIEPGDTVERLAVQEFSSAVRDGHDLRYYENVLLKVNRDRGRAGILGSFQIPDVFGGGGNNIQLVAGHRIWLVSPAYARTLEGVVPDGSLTNGAVAKVKRFAGHLEDLLSSVTTSPRYLDEVAGELAQSLRDHLPEVIGITAAFLVAESVSIAAAASPTGAGQLLAFLIQTLLAVLGAAGMVEAASAALAHGSKWMKLAWTAKGADAKVAAASREFLRMLVALAMAALAYHGAKASAGKSASILANGGGTATPALAIAGGGQAASRAGVILGPPSPVGGVGAAGGMMMEGKRESPRASDDVGHEVRSTEPKKKTSEAEVPPPRSTTPTKPVAWTAHGGKHVSKGSTPWSKIVEGTKSGPAKYSPGTNIEALERSVWDKGRAATNGRSWKVMEFADDIGASGGHPSRWVRVEESAGVIHGHPITKAEYLKLLR